MLVLSSVLSPNKYTLSVSSSTSFLVQNPLNSSTLGDGVKGVDKSGFASGCALAVSFSIS